MYWTPEQIATVVEYVRDDTHSEIADQLDVDRSSVSHALNEPSARRIKLLSRIAGLYGLDVDSKAVAYRVDEESMNPQ